MMSSEGHYRSIPTKAAIAPAGMLNLICCNCSVEVENPCQYLRCSRRKDGFKFLSACRQCHGLSCTNAPERQEDSGETTHSEEIGYKTDLIVANQRHHINNSGPENFM